MSIIFLKTPFKNITIGYTTKQEGFSHGNYFSFNLASHVGDNLKSVKQNRKHFAAFFAKNVENKWLKQEHTNIVYNFDDYLSQVADGIFSEKSKQLCTVLTADCLPVLLFDKSMTKVAAVHAGWRGLANGVLESALREFVGLDIVAWFGPCITQPYFEVSKDVYDIFVKNNPDNSKAFKLKSDKYLFDMKYIAIDILHKAHCSDIVDSKLCTYSDSRFFSYRRDGMTGRIASFIMLND